jgi:uncharacterized protein
VSETETETEPPRPLPNPDRDSQPWWDALARHDFVLQRCDECGTWRWPPREICNRCGSFAYTWTPVSGLGTVASWVVNQRAFLPGFEVPYAVVNVRLDEQDDCKLIGSFRGPIESLCGGLRVRAVFDDVSDGVTLVAWEAAEAPEAAEAGDG